MADREHVRRVGDAEENLCLAPMGRGGERDSQDSGEKGRDKWKKQ